MKTASFEDGATRLEETKRTARVLEIVQMIAAAPRRYHRRSLAERFEISERMIQKDLDLIRHGLRLELRNAGEGYYFETLPHLPTAGYSFSEGLALLAAARAAQAIPGVNSAELAAAIARLEAVFPEAFQPVLREATERLPRRAVHGHRQEMLTVLHRGLVERRRVVMVYATASREGASGARLVDPYHLLPYGRSWHLVAFDYSRREVRQFKVDRVQEARLLDEHYAIPADFDLDAYLGSAWGLMRGAAGAPEPVELLFEPEAGRWVAEEQWHASQESETLPDGRVRMTFMVGVTPEMVGWLLHYGARVYVVEPAWLREQVRDEHRKATLPPLGVHSPEEGRDAEGEAVT